MVIAAALILRPVFGNRIVPSVFAAGRRKQHAGRVRYPELRPLLGRGCQKSGMMGTNAPRKCGILPLAGFVKQPA